MKIIYIEQMDAWVELKRYFWQWQIFFGIQLFSVIVYVFLLQDHSVISHSIKPS